MKGQSITVLGVHYIASVTNNSSCFLPSIYEDRYRQLPFLLRNEKKAAWLRFPIIIGPNEKVILSEPERTLRVKSF